VRSPHGPASLEPERVARRFAPLPQECPQITPSIEILEQLEAGSAQQNLGQKRSLARLVCCEKRGAPSAIMSRRYK